MSEDRLHENGSDAEISSVSYDASKCEQLEDQVRRAQRMKELATLTGEIGRDFESILRSIRVYVNMSQEDLPEDHMVQEYLSQTLQGLEQAEDLVSNLLTFLQPESDSAREEVDLAELVEGVLRLVEPSFHESLTLRTQIEESCPVVGDPAQLQQVALNLLSNAQEAMEDQWDERPTVMEVKVHPVEVDADLAERYLHLEPGRYAHLAVSDTGPGMDADAEQRLVETPEGGGGELSLSVIHGVIEAHDGAITVRTESGEGTTFNIYLPLAPDGEAVPSAAVSQSERGDKRHVLVIDDDRTVRNLEGARLPRLGFEVTTEESARDALGVVEESPHQFDVILVDYRMPEMNGLEVVHALREAGCELPVVLMTGFGAQVSDAEARMVGVDRLIPKPIETQELEEVLREVG